jgi:predicted ArsR family transcriptional regulator
MYGASYEVTHDDLEVDTLAGYVDTTVAEIDDRLDELKAELAKLQSARSALTRRGPGRPAKAHSANGNGAGRNGVRSRGRRNGTRADQALALVRERPGITIPEIAASLGTEPNYLYRVMPNLVKDGKVRRDGQGWYPVS